MKILQILLFIIALCKRKHNNTSIIHGREISGTQRAELAACCQEIISQTRVLTPLRKNFSIISKSQARWEQQAPLSVTLISLPSTIKKEYSRIEAEEITNLRETPRYTYSRVCIKDRRPELERRYRNRLSSPGRENAKFWDDSALLYETVILKSIYRVLLSKVVFSALSVVKGFLGGGEDLELASTEGTKLNLLSSSIASSPISKIQKKWRAHSSENSPNSAFHHRSLQEKT